MSPFWLACGGLCVATRADVHRRSPRFASGILAAAFANLVGIIAALDLAFAQPAPAGGILADGNAVVTSFSGVQLPTLIKPGVDPTEKATIDLNGFALRVIDLQAPGASPQTQILSAPKPFTLTASQIGQIFAVALDNATPPSIYAAATSAYGLPIVVPDADGDGLPDRQEQGAPNAGFMPGLFGPAALGGGPGSIWQINGATGAVRLFANVALDGAPNSGPALGGLVFDPASSTLLIADRETGMIHRFDLTGAERGRYDHGLDGRPTGGLRAAPFDRATRLNIKSPPFQPADPATWGYAPPPRRIFGLALRGDRLYYAVAENLQVWSVANNPDGSFGRDARIEITVPPGQSASEISKIEFDDQGQMLLAERVAPSGAFDFVALTEEGGGRVLRYRLVRLDDPASGWQPVSDEYAIGFGERGRDGNGGVAVGYGYDANGRLDRNSCSGFVWSTGERLRVSADPSRAAALARGGPATVNGLQGSPIDLVRPANTPPLQSYFVDLDDRFEDANARGHAGDVAVFRACARAMIAQLPPATGEPALPRGPAPSEPDFPPELMGPPPEGPFGPGPDFPFGPDDWPPPPPPICPAGTHLEQNALQCCPAGQIPGVTGACQSPCANGSLVPADVFACRRGFQPGAAPGPGGPGTCWNGTAPVSLCPANTFGCKKCPKSPLKTCPAGWDEVTASPANLPTPAWWWSDRTCVAKPAQFGCGPGQQVGLDGVCQALCPGAPGTQWAWPVNRCCFNGTAPNALGQCGPGILVPPIWYLDYLATGTGPCIPPNCSAFEFTVIGRERFGRGSLTQRITLPPGSAVTEARITRGSRYCPASAWSCSRTGNVLTCSAENCGLAPGDQVVLRIAGNVAPDLTEPPPAPIDKTACAVLEWQAQSGPGPAAIEQLRDTGRVSPPPQRPVDGVGTDQYGRTSSKQACWTIRILGRPRPAPPPACAPNYVATSDGQCCLASQMTTGGVCCLPGQTPDARRRICVPVPTPSIPTTVVPPPSLVTCPSGTVRLRSGECCPRDQLTVRGQCCPPGQQPDSRRQRCVPVAPSTPTVTPSVPAPCPPGQMTRAGQCCPAGQRPDSRRRFCVPLAPERPAVTPPPCTGGKVRADDRCICPSGTTEMRGRCVPIRQTPQPQFERPRPQPEFRPPRPELGRPQPQVTPPKVTPPPKVQQLRPVPLRPLPSCPPGTRRVGDRCIG